MIYLFIIPILLFLVFILMIKPNRIRDDKTWSYYKNHYIAHRGLFNELYPENSLPAFQNAVNHQLGIEFDVQMTIDGKLVVFHDASMKRMCHVDLMPTKLTYDALQQYNLKDSNEKIPLLKDVLKVIDGKVPLIIEIKSEGKPIETVEKTCQMLKDYKGIYVMESFHPWVVYYLKKHYPHILRGQLSQNYFKKKDMNLIYKFIFSCCLTNFLTKPDFIAYDIRGKDFFAFRLMDKLYHFRKACWTIKNKKQVKKASKTFECLIFDSFQPFKEDE